MQRSSTDCAHTHPRSAADGHQGAPLRGAAPVLPRTTRSTGTSSTRVTRSPARRASRRSAARRPMSAVGICIVVNGGEISAASSMSSNPATDTCCGTAMPAPRIRAARRTRAGRCRTRWRWALRALDQLGQRSASARNRKRGLHVAAIRQLDTMRGERFAHARDALTRTIVVRRVAGDHRELAVPELQQVLGHADRCEPVGKTDAIVVAARIERPGQLERDARPREELVDRGRMVGAHQRETIDAALESARVTPRLHVRVVFVARQQQRVARLAQRALQRLDRVREDRIVERGDDGADRARPPRCERARRAVRHVAQHAHRVAICRASADARARLRQRARCGRQRHTRHSRDVRESSGGVTLHASDLRCNALDALA